MGFFPKFLGENEKYLKPPPSKVIWVIDFRFPHNPKLLEGETSTISKS